MGHEIGAVAMIDGKSGGKRVRARGFRRDTAGWCLERGYFVYDEDVRDIQPLVVIDPEDREQVERLVSLWTQSEVMAGLAFTDALQAALRSLLPTRKPEEPQGLGAVVEDADGNVWIRRGPTHYIAAEGSSSGFYNNAQTWGELAAVKVLSPGWSAES